MPWNSGLLSFLPLFGSSGTFRSQGGEVHRRRLDLCASENGPPRKHTRLVRNIRVILRKLSRHQTFINESQVLNRKVGEWSEKTTYFQNLKLQII